MENRIIREITRVLENISDNHYDRLSSILKKSRRVFVAGTGRSGLIGRCFAMRLRHLDVESYAVGETICPPIAKGDLLVLISCSGDKKTLLELGKIARGEGAKVLCITSAFKNPLAKFSDYRVIIRVEKSVQFGNSLFEQSVFIFLETFIEYHRRKEKISPSKMYPRHANLE